MLVGLKQGGWHRELRAVDLSCSHSQFSAMNLCLLEEKVRQMLGDWWEDVKCAGPGMSCPSLSPMEGQRQPPLLFLGELQPAYLGMGGRDVWFKIWRKEWLLTGMRL